MWWTRALALIAVGTLSVACDDDPPPVVGSVPDAAVGCEGDDACPMGQRCRAGTCEPIPGRPCGDQVCPPGESCIDGVCLAQCRADTECPDGQVCTDGQCESLRFSCASDDECAADEICVEGFCEASPGCTEDAHCAPGQSCVEGICEASLGCTEDAHCAAGQRCVDAECVAGPECAEDTDCADGATCEDGACVPPPPECVNDAECTMGLVCDGGACVLPEVACEADGDCALGQVCREGLCSPGSAECGVDLDCPPGRHCNAAIGSCVVNGPGSCAAPTVINRYGVFRGELGDAVNAVDGATCGRGGRGPEAVFALELPVATTLCLTSSGSEYDTVLYVRSDCLDGATELPDGCNDDSDFAGGDASSITLYVELGQRTYIVLDAFSDAAGAFVLTVTPGICGAAGPPPECVVAEDCGPEAACVGGGCAGLCDDVEQVCDPGYECVHGLCQVPILPPGAACTDDHRVDLEGFGRHEGTTVGGARDGDPSCGQGGLAPEVVHRVEFDREGLVCATTRGTGFDTLVYVRTDCEDDRSEVGCDDDIEFPNERASEMEFLAVAGQPYFVYVDGYDNHGRPSEGDYVLTLFPGPCGALVCADAAQCGPEEICQAGRCAAAPIPCAVDADCADDRVCDVDRGWCGARPSTAGTCGMPAHIDDFGEYRDRTTGARSELAEAGCGGVAGAEAVFRYRMDVGGPVCFSTEGSAFDTTLYVRTVCRDPASELACSDDVDFRNQNFSAVTIDAAAGVTYFVVVDGFGGAEGEFVLNVTRGPCVLEAGRCDDNADCLGRVCVEGACVDCADDAHCARGWVCDASRCVPPPCAADADCARGNICEANRCVQGRRVPAACLPENLFVLPGLGSREASTEGATAMAGAACGPADLSPEVAYRVVFADNQTVCVDVAANGFDPIVSVRSQCHDPETEIICNDDLVPGVQQNAAVTIDARAGIDYFVLVDGHDVGGAASAGPFTLTVSAGPCVQCRAAADCGPDRICAEGRCTVDSACDGDDDCPGELVCVDGNCAAAPALCEADFECAGQMVCQEGLCTALGACAAPIPLQIGAAARGTTAGDDDAHHYAGTCGGRVGLRLSPEDVYTFVGRGAGRVCLSTANRVGGTDYDTVMYVRRDNCAAGAELECNDDENFELGPPGNSQSTIEMLVEDGVRYYVFIDGYGRANAGQYMLTSSYGSCDALPPAQCAEDADCGLGQSCTELQQCVYRVGTCVQPVAINAFGRYESDTSLAWARHNGTCTFASGPESVYVLQLAQMTCLEVDTAESSYDTVLHVRRGECEGQEFEIACNDDVGDDSERARLAFSVEADVPYYIFADAYRRAGQLVLDIAEVPCEDP